MELQPIVPLPKSVIWDTTYACPLLCVHCYSESGRRPSKQLEPERLLAVTDALIEMGSVRDVYLSGGEPLVVKGIVEVIEQLRVGGIKPHVFTSGWNLDAPKVAQLAPLVASIHISLDGATAEVHDKVRRREGAFERAMRALEALDEASRVRRAVGKSPILFGLDCTIMRANFHQLETFVTDVATRFTELGFVNMGAAVPTGLAAEETFAATELLAEKELDVLRDPTLGSRLSTSRIEVHVGDNHQLKMHPDDIATGKAMMDTAQLEPDGSLRAMAIYEGTVGNLTSEPADVLWARACARWHDPFVTERLRDTPTLVAWAAATRAIDQRFGAPDDIDRIAKRRLPVVQEAADMSTHA